MANEFDWRCQRAARTSIATFSEPGGLSTAPSPAKSAPIAAGTAPGPRRGEDRTVDHHDVKMYVPTDK